MAPLSRNLALLCLAFWFGACLFFSAVVAPTLFDPDVASGLSRDMAGAINTAVLRRVYLITYICGGLSAFMLIVCWVLERGGSHAPKRAFFLCLLLLVGNAVNDVGIHRRLSRARVEMANCSPSRHAELKASFDRWHKGSVWIFTAGLAAGGLALLLLLPPGGGRHRR
ncbi:MAG: DUF4149 domain-containing protein [Verrucomicrobiae bacterium]|nr:DUF4149 domain-containing protein [Verrucomicrobiae bacterium]